MIKLGVNIDHVATLRQARKGFVPDPVQAAKICERAGANSIVCHLREDRRHIQDRDVRALRKSVRTRLNLEMSLNRSIIDFALFIKPDVATLVPERRQELTTEGGLDVKRSFKRIKDAVTRLQDSGIETSLFIAPVAQDIEWSVKSGARIIEIHTGHYALAKSSKARAQEFQKIKAAATYAHSLGLRVSAGHGLDYQNTAAIVAIPEIEELNIGHSIICEAVFAGLPAAVKQMKALLRLGNRT